MSRPYRRPLRLAAGALTLALSASACGSSGPAKPSASRPTSTTATTLAPVAPSGSVPDVTASAAPTPWSEALHDAAHSGTAGVLGPQSAHLTWTRNLGGPISAGPAVAADGTIYASSNAGVLHALDPATGADRWTFDGGGSADNGQDLSTTAAVLADGTILFPGPKSTLFARDPTGHLQWSEQLRGSVLSPAVGTGGKVYVADSVGDLEALQPTATSPGKKWMISIGKASFGSPAIAADGTIYGTEDDQLIAVTDQGSSGTIKWRFKAGAAIEVSPSVAPDGTVVLGTNDPYEYGISPTGSVKWRYPRKVFSYSTPAVSPDGLAYFGDNDGYVDVVKAADGKVVGRYNGTAKAISNNGIGVWTAPLVDPHHDVYFGTAAGHIFGYSYDGTKLFDFDAGAIVDSYPALTANGTLLIGSDNGNLYALHA